MVSDNPAFELAFVSESRRSRLSKEQLIRQIQALNPSASATYLAEFSSPDLLRYLDRLGSAEDPRSPWVREKGEPAIEVYRLAG